MQKKQGMDKIARESTWAIILGISYGNLKARQHDGLLPELPEDAPDPIPNEVKQCRVCGAPLRKGKKRYCSWDCEHAAANARARETYRRKHNADYDHSG